jgi:hypothetical protein
MPLLDARHRNLVLLVRERVVRGAHDHEAHVHDLRTVRLVALDLRLDCQLLLAKGVEGLHKVSLHLLSLQTRDAAVDAVKLFLQHRNVGVVYTENRGIPSDHRLALGEALDRALKVIRAVAEVRSHGRAWTDGVSGAEREFIDFL